MTIQLDPEQEDSTQIITKALTDIDGDNKLVLSGSVLISRFKRLPAL
jgi:hypothetical protein